MVCANLLGGARYKPQQPSPLRGDAQTEVYATTLGLVYLAEY
jgi:hypothetical protein